MRQKPIPRVFRAVSARRLAIAAALAALMLLPGCGGSGQGDPAQKPPPVARPQDFPKPGGKTIAQMRKRYAAGGPVLAPSVSQLQPGTNRFGFGLFDRARAQIADAPVVLYVANATGGAARGPYPAHFESLHVQPQYLSRSVSSDPTAAKSVYVADLHFPKAGRYEVFGLARLDDRLVAATPAGPALNVLGGRGAGRGPAPAAHPHPHQELGGRRPGEDRHPRPALDDARHRLLRRVGEEADHVALRHSGAVPEPGLRPGGGHRRAGEGPAPRTMPNGSTWRSTTTTRWTRASARR